MCTAQPTGFGKLVFYARIQRADAGGAGGGMLIAHSCVEGGALGHWGSFDDTKLSWIYNRLKEQDI